MLKSPPNLQTPTVGSSALKAFTLSPAIKRGEKIGLFGTGGIGKTSLASRAPGRTAFFDLEDRIHALGLDVPVVSGVETWSDLRNALKSPALQTVDTIVIDSVTVAEELAVAHTIANVPTEKGQLPKSIEGYGYGKGYQHVFDTFLPLLGDLDTHCRAGRNVVLVMHECMSNVPNPQGDDYIRYEPRLQNPTSGKASIRLRVKEWLDHLMFIGFDIDVKDNKAKGSGTRTIYPIEMPHCMAKSIRLCDPVEYTEGSDELWRLLKLTTAKN